ncbi:MAG: hypothetical protein Q8K74_01360 [Candidatus Nitrotoga sp.]|nr:hypothetical protein [Candidatus Nitrotoga sp.]MDP1854686.1 hypothetical protein [Candidatus Nitrotoga sp.]
MIFKRAPHERIDYLAHVITDSVNAGFIPAAQRLPAAMVNTHALIPIHPFVWELANFLGEAGLHDVIRAPQFPIVST